MKIISLCKSVCTAAAFTAAVLITTQFSMQVNAAQTAQTRHDSVPSIKVEEPREDISQKIVSSASTYYELSLNDELSKAPDVLKAASSDEQSVDSSDNDGEEDTLRVDMSEDELYMFASEVYCEAGDESFESQVGVAQVIINRILSPRYPNTLEGVLYQSGQFPPATSGFMDSVMASGEGAACRPAVMAALHGADVVGNYLYFNMTSGVDFSIVTSSMTIDGTTFYSLAE